MKVVDRCPHYRSPLFAQDVGELVGEDGLTRTVDTVYGYSHRIHTGGAGTRAAMASRTSLLRAEHSGAATTQYR
ncbi:MAG: hypothetical protein ABI934_03760 [Actinomycetota bacterium]